MPIKRDRNRERFAQKPIDESHTWLLSDSTVQIVKKDTQIISSHLL